jgi:GNAT superfamily N-acetyltransferase
MSLNLYAAYISEREGFQLLSNDSSFLTYKIMGDECYIRDIYTAPAARHSKSASKLADEVANIAKLSGCKYLSGTVDARANGASANTLVMAHYGFLLIGAKDNVLFYRKDL